MNFKLNILQPLKLIGLNIRIKTKFESRYWKTSSEPETISKMHTTLVYEFYDENGEWFDITDVPVKRDHKSTTYLGDLNDSNINNMVDYLNRPDVVESNKANYKEFNIELLDTNCYCQTRKNAVLVYLQLRINTKFAADGTRIQP